VNSFDAVVYACLAGAAILGFHSGLLRSLATIFGYAAAMPVAVILAPKLSSLTGQGPSAVPQWLALTVAFLGLGALFAWAARLAIQEIAGTDISIPDRLGGAVFGAVRIGMVAVMMVLIFDRIIPVNRQPPFLAGSNLRPILSSAGQMGLKSLPPDVEAYIDRVKRERGI
jgi:membrane protein required for colicin V production